MFDHAIEIHRLNRGPEHPAQEVPGEDAIEARRRELVNADGE